MGAFNFLFPFILTSAIFYGLLRRSQIFGKPEETVAINGVIALVAAFMVWAYPILTGIDIETQLSKYFFFGTVSLLTIVIGLLAGSMILPEGIGKFLGEKVEKGRSAILAGILIMGLLIGLGILVASGLVGTFFPSEEGKTSEIYETVAIFALILGTIVLLVWVTK